MGRFLRAEANSTVLSPTPFGGNSLNEAPVIGALGTGGFAVAWNWDEDPTQAGSNFVTSRRIFAADGSAVTGIDNLATTGSPNSITALSGGGFGVIVEFAGQVRLERQSDIGDPIGGPVIVDQFNQQLGDGTRTLTQLRGAGPLSGQLVVSAFVNTQGGSGSPQVMRLNEDGSLVPGSLYTMPVTTSGMRPLVGTLSGGGYYVVASRFAPDQENPFGTDLVAQFFDMFGNASGGLVDLTPGERDDLSFAFISTTALSNGGFVFSALPTTDLQNEPYVRLYDGAGTPVSEKIVLASRETGSGPSLSNENTSVTPLSDGSGFVATWAITGSIQAQAFDLRGAKIGPQYEVRVAEAGKLIESGGITTLTNGALATVWREFKPSAVSESITAQTFSLQSFAAWQGTSGADTFVSPVDGPLELVGGAGNDTLTGNAQGNILNGGADNDVLDGGAGNDVFEYGSGNNGFDAVVGGSGIDEIRAIADNAVIGLSSISGVESIIANTYSNVRISGTAAADTLNFNFTFMSGISSIDGGAGDDTIYGPRAASDLRGGAGNDTIYGGVDNDTLSGGRNNDILVGGAGDDIFRFAAGDGIDSYDGGIGFDQIVATTANAVIAISAISGIEAISSGGFANVSIIGTTVAETLDFSGTTLTGITQIDAGSGNDTVIGSTGNDTIVLGSGNDVFRAGNGNDIFIARASAGSDIIDGGAGFDTINAAAINVAINVAALTSIEAISGNGFTGVSLVGSTLADVLDFSSIALTGISFIDAGAGNDTVIGSAGNDTIVLGSGNDTLNGGNGNDIFLARAGAGLDVIDGGIGYDTVQAAAASVSITLASYTGIEEISANGFAGVKLVGSAAADTMNYTGVTLTGIESISGGAGNDTITGSAANDRILGGTGRDVMTGGLGADTFAFATSAESGFGTTRADLITDFLSGTDIIDLTAIDADTSIAGDQAFTFIGSAAFTGLGQLRIGVDTEGKVALFGNTTGTLAADFQISFDSNPALLPADIHL